jgi:serine phosphatase RsbU (regulator of sigma subunit)
MLLSGGVIQAAGETGRRVLVAIEDVTERRRIETARESHVTDLEVTTKDLVSRQEQMRAQSQKLRVAHRETSRLLSQESSLLRRLQEVFTDVPQDLPGVRFGHLYRSATEEARIGGDFYDVFGAKQGRIGLLIGDVSGHGIEAARTASLIKDTVHAFAHQFRHPHLVLRETNRLLAEKNLHGFTTVFLSFLDPESGTLICSSAGHPPPLLAADGQVSVLEQVAAPLGAFPDSHFRDREIHIGKGAVLLLYTDGVTEARDAKGVLFGERRLSDSLGRLAAEPVERLPGLVMDELLRFSVGRLQDDAAMLAVRYVGK